MTTKDIEELATNAVKKSVLTSGFLAQYISENDKTPSWDGFIYIYNDEKKAKSSLYGRVPVQVKGTYQDDLSKKEIRHRIDIDDLKSYQKDGGILFFVVYISQNGEKDKIYYSMLLRSYIEKKLSTCKSGQHSTYIDLTEFPTNHNSKVNIVRDFYDNLIKLTKTMQPKDTHVPLPEKHRIIRPLSPMVTRYLNRHIYENFGCSRKADVYMPSDFSYEESSTRYNNIMNPLREFIAGTLKSYLQRNKITLHQHSRQSEEQSIQNSNSFTAVIVEGSQCAGKSTIIAQIIYEMDIGKLPLHPFFLLSFSDNRLKDNPMTCASICDYLNLQETDLDQDTILLIDALDESDWSQQDATKRIVNLVNELSSLRCRVIITCRSGYLNINPSDKQFLNIRLHHFTEQQAIEWIAKYRTAFPSQDVSKIQNYINHVLYLKGKNDISAEDRNLINTTEVILMPHIMTLCIQYQVNIKNVNNLAQLYTQVFLPNAENSLLLNQYSVRPQYLTAEDEENILYAATQIAILCMCNSENTISRNDIEDRIGNSQMITVVCNRFLLTKANNGYSFAHQSIPAFLVAQHIYTVFSKTDRQISENKLLNEINDIILNKDVLTELVQEYTHYLVEDKDLSCGNRISWILHRFLKGELSINNDATSIIDVENQHMIWCDGLVRLYIALNNLKYDKIIGFPFFQQFDIPERMRLVYLLSNPSGQASKSLGNCELRNMELDYINLRGAEFQGRYIHKMRMHKARMDKCSLTGSYIIESDLSLSCLDDTKSKNVQFHNSILCGCSFKNASLNGSIFTNCNLANADIRGSDVLKLKFENCILGGLKVDIMQLKDLIWVDPLYILQNQICVYLNDELLVGERLTKEYEKILPVHSLLALNRIT